MVMFDTPAVYRSLFVVEFTKFFAVSDCNVLLILSFFMRVVAALYRPSRCLTACQPRALTVGFFITFLTKSKILQPLCRSLFLFLVLGAAL